LAKYTGPNCRICRREGAKFFLKGECCHSEKCSFDKRPYGPGDHGKDKKRITEYKIQLREKQKVKAIYGMLEKQFRIFYARADKLKGATGENLLGFLERRLDNIVFRLGMANSRSQARQLINHRHFIINGKLTDIPSYVLKEGDVLEIKEKSKSKPVFKDALEYAGERTPIPSWLELDKNGLKGKVLRNPGRDDIQDEIKENLIVELYSK
jgi:small subunit ribosomal protein S4